MSSNVVIFNLGDIIWCSFKPMIKIYTLLVIGYFYGKRNIFSLQTSRDVSYINLHVLLPTLIFQTIVTNLQYTDIKQIAICCFNSFLYIIISGLLVTLLALADLRTNWLIIPDWRFGSTFYMMFSTGSNIMVAFLQSFETYPNYFFSTAEELNRGMAFIFIAFACTEFVVYNLNGQRLVKLDFDLDPESSCENDDNYDINEKKKDPIGNNVINNGNNSIRPTGQENRNDNDNESISSISSSEESDSISANNNPVRFSNKSKPNNKNNDIRSLTTVSTSGSLISADLRRSNSRGSSLYNRSNNGKKLRAIELRSLPTQKLDDVVNEFGGLAEAKRRASRNNNKDIENPLDLIRSASRRAEEAMISDDNTSNNISISATTTPSNKTNIPFISFVVARIKALSKKDSDRDSKEGIILSDENDMLPDRARSNLFKFFMNFIKSLFNPLILSVLVSFTVAMIPWLKNLFVFTEEQFEPANTVKTGIHNAPDDYPPLNIFMTYASYMGSAQPQISLFLLGAVFSRLSFEKIPDFHFLVKITFLSVLKLCVLPIIGISWISSVYDNVSWFGDQVPQNSAIYVMCLVWALPGYTSQIFLTALYTRNDDKNRLVNLAWIFIVEFSMFIVTFPFISSFVLKHMLHY